MAKVQLSSTFKLRWRAFGNQMELDSKETWKDVGTLFFCYLH